MPKTYSIKWIIDDALAQAAFRRGDKALADLEAKALRTAQALQGVHQQVATTAVAAQNRINGAVASATTAQVNGANRVATAIATANGHAVASTTKKIGAIEAIELKWSVRDYKMRVKAEADKQRLDDFARARYEKAIRDRETLEANWLAREYKERVAYEKKKETAALGPNGRLAQVRRQQLSEEQLQLAARNRAHDVYHKKRIDQILEEKYATKDSFGEAIAQATGLGQAVTTVGAAILGLEIGKQVIGAVVLAMQQAKTASESMARQVLDTLGGLREIAAIKGKFAPDAEDLARHIDIRKRSGLSQAEAVDYEAELANVLGTVDPAKFTDEERSRLAVLGAQQVSRRGGNVSGVTKPLARTQALLADFVKPRGDGKVYAADVMAMTDAVDVINSMGAASQQVSTTQSNELITSLTAPDLKGSFDDPRKAVALNTIASKFESNASATATIEAVRQARGFTKWRVGKGMTASQAQTLKDAGITEGDDPAESMRKLFRFAQKTMGKDEAFDAFMARRGFRDQTGNKRLAQFYNEYRKGNYDRVMAEADKPLGRDYESKTRAFLASQTGRDALSRVAVDAAKIDRGKRAAELVISKQEAEAAFVAGGGDDTITGQLGQRIAGREAIIEREAVKSARKQAGLPGGHGLGFFGRSVKGTLLGQGPISALGADMIGTRVSGMMDDRAEEINYLRRIAESNERIERRRSTTPGALPIGGGGASPLR